METLSNEERLSEVKSWGRSEGDLIWWADTDGIGAYYFSFDKKKVFSMWADYPYALTPEQKAIFDKENPYWADFFKSRCKND